MVDDDPVAAWERVLAERGQWREDMRPVLEAHRDELPHPEDIADHHDFHLRPDRAFPVLIPEAEMGDRLDHQLGWVASWEVPWFPSRRDCTAREARAREKVIELVSAQLAPKTRVAYTSLDGAAVRVNAHLPGAIVRNVDIAPGATRRTYDARVHSFPINWPRRVRTVECAGVPAGGLGTLVTEDLSCAR
jgi:hypothetical protein